MEENNGQARNDYYDAFDAIVAALDALAKTLTVDAGDDGTPVEELPVRDHNSYFESFRAMAAALGRVGDAMAERLGAISEGCAAFPRWREDSYSLAVGKGASAASNGVSIGWNSTAGTGTGTGAKDAGAVALGKAAGAWGIGALALGRAAQAGSAAKRTTLPTVQLGAGANEEDGTLQFRDWRLVGADGIVPKERLPAYAGGLVEASLSYGSADDRTTGLWYAVFSPEGIGIADEAACLKSVTLVCSNNTTLPASQTRALEVKSEDGAVLIARSENEASFSSAGANVKFTFATPVELRRGVKYRLKLTDSTGANASAPVMLARTDGSGELGVLITGGSALNAAYFPCMAVSVVRPAPDIAAAIASCGAFAFAAPAAEGGVVRLVDRAMNDVALDGTAVALEFPDAAGHSRAFVLRISMTAETEWSLPAGAEFESDDDLVFADIQVGTTAVFIFSETTPGRYMVSRKTAKTVAKE